MKPSRKIALVVNQVRMDDEDQLDVLFWLDKLPIYESTSLIFLNLLEIKKPLVEQKILAI